MTTTDSTKETLALTHRLGLTTSVITPSQYEAIKHFLDVDKNVGKINMVLQLRNASKIFGPILSLADSKRIVDDIVGNR
jgi:hypothetical protein